MMAWAEQPQTAPAPQRAPKRRRALSFRGGRRSAKRRPATPVTTFSESSSGQGVRQTLKQAGEPAPSAYPFLTPTSHQRCALPRQARSSARQLSSSFQPAGGGGVEGVRRRRPPRPPSQRRESPPLFSDRPISPSSEKPPQSPRVSTFLRCMPPNKMLESAKRRHSRCMHADLPVRFVCICVRAVQFDDGLAASRHHP